MKLWAKVSKITWRIYDEYECKEAALNEIRNWEKVEEGWFSDEVTLLNAVWDQLLWRENQGWYDWLREETAKRWSPEIGGVWPSVESHARIGEDFTCSVFQKKCLTVMRYAVPSFHIDVRSRSILRTLPSEPSK